MEKAIHELPFFSRRSSWLCDLEDGHIIFPFSLTGQRGQFGHSCFPFNIENTKGDIIEIRQCCEPIVRPLWMDNCNVS